ncbi:MAG: SWIM zinc finger family protein [Bacteroidetes bacterium]|nr:SWIM zinc finger family protein [Bacteroidota bacterium]
MQLTYDHILTLAPDPGTAHRAKSVAHAQRWHTLEGNGRAIWGTLGDPADPYRTVVDLQGPGFHCTCPVRRLPCKHGVGLLLLFSKNNDAFRVADEPPDWVSGWLKKRGEFVTTKPETPTRTSEVEQALAEKRRQNREKRLLQMSAGLAELESWLLDLFRQGLATLEGQAGGYFSDLAARMVDAKLGTLARRIRQLPPLMGQADWHGKLLAELGDIYLIVRAFQRMEQLPEPLQDDLLSLAGVNFKKEEILTLDGIGDRWLLAGQTEELEDANLLARRTWLIGEKSGKVALLLDFSWGGQGFETSWRMGTVLHGEVVFFPSAWPQRALLKNFEYSHEPFELRNGHPSLTHFANGYARVLAANPWLAQFPAFLENVVPVFLKNNFVLVDNDQRQIPLLADEHLGWKLVALSVGRPVSIFGTWDGVVFSPLSVVAERLFRGL